MKDHQECHINRHSYDQVTPLFSCETIPHMQEKPPSKVIQTQCVSDHVHFYSVDMFMLDEAKEVFCVTVKEKHGGGAVST